MKRTNTRLSVGRYLISPLIALLDDGRYEAGVSIRSGRGSGTCDRIFRFTRRFACSSEAQRYALQQGLAWLRTAPAAA